MRGFALVLVGILAVGLAAPYVDAGGYRERIQRALEGALDRKVTVGKVRFNLLTGPGFSVEDVTIHEHPAIGIEPMAYVESLTARVRLTTLWTRRLSFSNLRLHRPTLNLSKSEDGVWNFQLLGQGTAVTNTAAREFPSFEVREGRINFKFAEYKTIFYLSEADLDVTPLSADRLDIRFSGQPARTDQAAQSFGRLLARGVWKRMPDESGEVDLNLELEPSGMNDLVRLVEGQGIGVHGVVASRARVTGRLPELEITGQLRIADIHRWDLLPTHGDGWNLRFRGSMDVESQSIHIETDRRQNPEVPLLMRVRVSDYLSNPRWAASVEFQAAALSGFVEAARHMGAALPEGLSADGEVAGVIGYSHPEGLQGQLRVHDSSVRLRDMDGLSLPGAEFVIAGSRVRILPSVVTLSAGQTAEVRGDYRHDTERFELEIATRGMNVSELRTGSGRLFGAAGVPVLEACRQGTWRGSVRYRRDGPEASWSGRFDIANARIDIKGMGEPLRLDSAKVDVAGRKLSVSQIRGRAGTIGFGGDYQHDGTVRPERLNVEIDEADLVDLETLFMPTLRVDPGLLARFRLRNPKPPEWLRSRHFTGRIRIGRLTAAGREWSIDEARAVWDGTTVRLYEIAARSGEAELSGELAVNLAATTPRYTFSGNLENFDFRGGVLSVGGALDSRGFGEDLLEGAQGSGTFAGDDLDLSSEMEFRSISGRFELLAGRRLRLNGVQAAEGLESYTGQGATQPDGRLLLELTSGARQVRVPVAR